MSIRPARRENRVILPLTIRPGGWISRRIEALVTDLPQPDSPTSARILPRLMWNVTPSTACNAPCSVKKCTPRSSTVSSTSPSVVAVSRVGSGAAFKEAGGVRDKTSGGTNGATGQR